MRNCRFFLIYCAESGASALNLYGSKTKSPFAISPRRGPGGLGVNYVPVRPDVEQAQTLTIDYTDPEQELSVIPAKAGIQKKNNDFVHITGSLRKSASLILYPFGLRIFINSNPTMANCYYAEIFIGHYCLNMHKQKSPLYLYEDV